MALFRYVAIAPDGTQVKAAVEAASEETLRNELLLRNFEVQKIKPKRSFTEIEVTKQRVPATEIMHFSRQLAAFVRSGIPIIDALEVVEEGTPNKRFKEIIVEMRESISAGVPLSEAIGEHAAVFPPYYLGILRSAEMTGQLDTALDQLSTYIERDHEAKSRIKSAITYPVIIMMMSIVTVVIMSVWVLPRFTVFFEDMNAELPIATRMLINLSNFSQDFWYLYVGVLALLALAVVLGQKSDSGRVIRDRIFLKLPLIGDIVMYAVVERFCRIVAAMVRAGVPLPEALAASIEGANNKVFERALHEAQERMLEGEGIAEPIADTHLFPKASVQMMRVGENTGTLDQQLDNSAQYYSRELEYKLKKLTSVFEPAVIIFMGVVVGFVAVALVSAMYGVFQGGDMRGGG